jgi:O-methyltransferase involved in polyketide biosynthesis
LKQRPFASLHPVDFKKRKLVDVLIEDESWDRAAPTIILAEGLLQYLTSQAVQDLFTQCAAVSTESLIAFTYIPTDPDGRPDAGPWTSLVLWLLKKSGEPWLWSIHPEALGHFLEISGWTNAPKLVGASEKHGVELYAVATKSSPYLNTGKLPNESLHNWWRGFT